MRILLDESVPWRLGRHLTGHTFTSVQKHGWASIKNGKLLALAAGEFDVLLTADKGMEYQQNPGTLPVAILVVRAKSNRMEDLVIAVPAILEALASLAPRTLTRVSGRADR
jgi:predicted nuclease of predicted toxin-antitoxin system